MGLKKWGKRITASTFGSWEGWERRNLKMPENSRNYMEIDNQHPNHPIVPRIAPFQPTERLIFEMNRLIV